MDDQTHNQPPISSPIDQLSPSNPQNVENINTTPTILPATTVDTIEEQQENSKRGPTPASWKPGQSGNPNGRPKGDWTWKDLYKEVAEEMFEVKQNNGVSIKSQFKKLVAQRIFREAVNGNIGAIKELANRMDGMPKQTVEQTGEINLNVNDMLTKVYGE